MLRSTQRTLFHSVKQVRSASSTAPPVRRPYTPRTRPSSPSSSTSPSTLSTPSTPTPTPTTPAPSTSQVIGSSSVASPPSPSEPQTAPTSTSPTLSPSSELPSNDTYASYTTPTPIEGQPEIDWSTSYHGLSSIPFTSTQADTLMRPLQAHEIEIKPGTLLLLLLSITRSLRTDTRLNNGVDGLLYLPEILYRRILNRAFGPGGWGLVPRRY